MIAEVRGEGLLIGLRAVVPAAELVDALRAEKMIAVSAGDNVVRLLPPLIIERAGNRRGDRTRLDRACATLSRRIRGAQAGGGAMSAVRHFLDLIDVPAADLAQDDRRRARHEGANATATIGRSPARPWR